MFSILKSLFSEQSLMLLNILLLNCSFRLLFGLLIWLSRDSTTNDAVGLPRKEPVIPAFQDSNYINPPQIVSNAKVSTFTTTIPLNGNVINHLIKMGFHE
jgi:hypothetical protein